jgi:rhodanese-related sulfurtransferase
MKKQIFKPSVLFLFSAIAGMLLFGCGGSKKADHTEDNKFDMLIEYIENSGDFINSEEVPAAVWASEVIESGDKNIHIIDIRTPEDYAEGHVPKAVNVAFSGLIDYFETKIQPTEFEKIYLFSSDGQASFFASGLLRLLGYDNVHPVRFGMSAWHEDYAVQYWLPQLTSKYTSALVNEENMKPEPGDYPQIKSQFNTGYEILRERSINLLQQSYKDFVITADEVFSDPDSYFIMCYWKKEYFDLGHISGSIYYEPKKSLGRQTQLNTLPTDKTIVVYCNSGHHSSTVTAYLRILGYDAKSFYYGANSFMYNLMLDKTDHAFTDENIYNYPVEKTEGTKQDTPTETKKAAPQGGC